MTIHSFAEVAKNLLFPELDWLASGLIDSQTGSTIKILNVFSFIAENPLSNSIGLLAGVINPVNFLGQGSPPAGIGTLFNDGLPLLLIATAHSVAIGIIWEFTRKGDYRTLQEAAGVHFVTTSLISSAASWAISGLSNMGFRQHSPLAMGALYAATQVMGYVLTSKIVKHKFSDLAINKLALRIFLLGFGYAVGRIS